MTILPNNGYLLIEILKADKQTKEGIYIPETSTEDSMKAKVLSIGRPKLKEGGIFEEPPRFEVNNAEHKLKVGDIILFRSHAVATINGEFNNENQVGFLSFDSVYGIEL